MKKIPTTPRGVNQTTLKNILSDKLERGNDFLFTIMSNDAVMDTALADEDPMALEYVRSAYDSWTTSGCRPYEMPALSFGELSVLTHDERYVYFAAAYERVAIEDALEYEDACNRYDLEREINLLCDDEYYSNSPMAALAVILNIFGKRVDYFNKYGKAYDSEHAMANPRTAAAQRARDRKCRAIRNMLKECEQALNAHEVMSRDHDDGIDWDEVIAKITRNEKDFLKN